MAKDIRYVKTDEQLSDGCWATMVLLLLMRRLMRIALVAAIIRWILAEDNFTDPMAFEVLHADKSPFDAKEDIFTTDDFGSFSPPPKFSNEARHPSDVETRTTEILPPAFSPQPPGREHILQRQRALQKNLGPKCCPAPVMCTKNCFVYINEHGCQDCQCLWQALACDVDDDCPEAAQFCDLGKCNCRPGLRQDMMRSGACEQDPDFKDSSSLNEFDDTPSAFTTVISNRDAEKSNARERRRRDKFRAGYANTALTPYYW
ncbi:unnamed protein product [Haemonchus placei]|uniref:TIL domain-containing protein n=1 Tax=Haemonchus placei TaxID=6290 RepID=A0A0N4WM34_HAEPC|nr:unnamed protein product [Haemonchus placei]